MLPPALLMYPEVSSSGSLPAAGGPRQRANPEVDANLNAAQKIDDEFK